MNKKSRIYGTSDSFAKINLICQICQRVRSVRESNLWGRSVRPWESDLWGRESPICEAVRVRSVRPWESVWGRSDSTGRCCHPRSYLTDFTAKRIASAGVRERPIGLPHGLSRTLTASQIWESDLWGRSVRLICEADLWGRERPCSDSQTDHMTLWWEAVVGLPRPHRFESPISLSRTPGDRTLPAEAMRLAVKSVR